MTEQQTANIIVLAGLIATALLMTATWVSYNYPQLAQAQDIEPIGYHTNLLRSACYTLENN